MLRESWLSHHPATVMGPERKAQEKQKSQPPFESLLRAIVYQQLAGAAANAEEIIVIGNANLTRLDVATLEKIYTGKVIEVEGIPVKPVNANSGSAVRP